jgi:AcrR family transcriptional regulator
MPAPVDHEARRQQVARVAADLVAAGGVDALTVRGLAEALGFSTAVVSHYFKDKQDLLLVTYRAAADRTAARFEVAAGAPTERLRSCLEALLPLDRERLDDWKVFYAFWGGAMSSEVMAEEQRSHVHSARRRIEGVLAHEPAAAGMTQAARHRTARRLLVQVHGVAMQAVFDPVDWSPGRQRRFIQDELRTLFASFD